MRKEGKPPILEFWLTREQWVQFTRAMDLCHRLRGGPVGPAECLELVCRSYVEHSRDGSTTREGMRRRGTFLEQQPGTGGPS